MSDSTPSPADNGWDSSASAWIEQMERGDLNRVLLLDDVMLRLCGDVRGRTVVDIGCGEGRFCRMLADRGAHSIGVDPTPALIECARAKQPGAEFHLARAEKLPLTDASIDLAISYVALIDVPGYGEAIREMARVLRPGGACVVANLNSFVTAGPQPSPWARDANGRKLHWRLDDYMIERPNRAAWAGVAVVNWHRPFSAYLREFLAVGLVLEVFDEPMPAPEVAAQRGMDDFHRVPLFHVMVWRKGAARS